MFLRWNGIQSSTFSLGILWVMCVSMSLDASASNPMEAVKLPVLQPCCQALASLSMRTTDISEQVLSALPLRQRKLLNISNLLPQLPR